ncbi:DUF6781 family protein [Rivibacter subsaxonicus]|uniref:Uncharacterized protein n=1 Tax=Rivibacter subsaxonicus TaxID=457575 RepID=A0A4Q7W193_9BURK|nr:DUF6781 family protein [Rivibacter subsaxonicus]RZU02991.1 hypothetical protein EV670_1022 [Rivibacter subsaxonicus]
MATRTGIDQNALIEMFSQASAKQGEALRQAVSQATLGALQGRELSLANIRSVLKSVTQAASIGAEQHGGRPAEVEAMLGAAVSGMDAALLQAVEANRRALQQFVDQGVGLQSERLQGALADLEKMESTFFGSVAKAAQSSGGSLQGPWQQVLESMKLKGSDTGMQASATVEQLMAQTQSGLRDSRAMGLRAAQAMMDSYAALVSGVLIGMSEGLQKGAPAPTAESKGRRR